MQIFGLRRAVRKQASQGKVVRGLGNGKKEIYGPVFFLKVIFPDGLERPVTK